MFQTNNTYPPIKQPIFISYACSTSLLIYQNYSKPKFTPTKFMKNKTSHKLYKNDCLYSKIGPKNRSLFIRNKTYGNYHNKSTHLTQLV